MLSVLWKASEPQSVGEITDKVGGGLAYATVSTILTRLHAKELVERTTVGRAYWYRATVTQSAYVSEQVRALLSRGNRSEVLEGFLGGLSRDDEQALRKMFEDARDVEGDGGP